MSESSIFTTTENKRVYAFDIIIMQELSSISRDEAISSLITCSDDIMNTFDNDYTLGGNCYLSQISPAEFGEIV